MPPITKIAPDTWSPALDDYLYVFGFATGWQRVTCVKPIFVYEPVSQILVFRMFPVAQPGDSGGFILNKKGELVGVVLAVAHSQFTAAVPVTMLDLLGTEETD